MVGWFKAKGRLSQPGDMPGKSYNEKGAMRRLIKTTVAAFVLVLTLTIPAQARVPRTVIWQCTLEDGTEVDFVTAAEAARHGIDTANATAGETFHTQFGERCIVLPAP
jgi:hypothetical protein